MTAGKAVLLVTFGIVLGIALTIGAHAGIRENISALIGIALGNPQYNGQLDPSVISGIIQDIFSSEQGKAIINDIIQNYSGETLDLIIKQAAQSLEFKKALTEVLESFLDSDEGRALVLKTARNFSVEVPLSSGLGRRPHFSKYLLGIKTVFDHLIRDNLAVSKGYYPFSMSGYIRIVGH